MASRIQREQTPGWRPPKGARNVGRGTIWGNPWVVARADFGTGWFVMWAGTGPVPEGSRHEIPAADQYDAYALAAQMYQSVLLNDRALARRIPDLKGRDLLCWCPKDLPCHADLLLELAERMS